MGCASQDGLADLAGCPGSAVHPPEMRRTAPHLEGSRFMSAMWVICLTLLLDGPTVPVVRADDVPFDLGLVPSTLVPYQSLEGEWANRGLIGFNGYSWYGEAGIVFYNRALSHVNFGTNFGAVQQLGNGAYFDLNASDNRLIGARDVDLGAQPGLRFLVGRTIWADPCDDRGCVAKPCETPDAFRSLSVELGYLGLLQQQVTTRYSANPSTPLGAMASRFAGIGSDGTITPVLWPFDYANINTLTYRSRFDSAELNLRYSTSAGQRMPIEMLAGIRYMKLQENLDYLAGNTNPHLPALVNVSPWGAYSTRTDNDLIGLQLGGDLSYRLTADWSLMGRGRGGLLVNSASQRSNLNGSLVAGGMPFNDTGSASGVGMAGLFEFGIHTNYQLTSNLSLMVGYQGLYLSDLSTAPRQFMWNAEASGRNNLDRAGSLFFFGPAAGIEWKW